MKTIDRALRALVIAVLALGGNATHAANHDFSTNAQSLSRQWQGHKHTPLSQRMATPRPGQRAGFRSTAFDAELPAADSFGPLYLPSGEEWTYTSHVQYVDDNSFDHATFTIYNGDLQQVGQFDVNIELGPGETGVNYMAINPNISRKFFNVNDAYEVMVYVHATTEDYTGHIYTKVYSLSDGQEVCTMEGDAVLMVDMARNSWEEDYYMVFFQEEFGVDEEADPSSPGAYTYFQNFSIYKKAGWGTGPQLLHTFNIDYNTISGSGENMLPIIPVKHGNTIYYVLPHYLKPYFDPTVAVWEEPVINPGNAFVIDLYNSDFEIVKTTTLPMEVTDGFLYTFPEMGGLMYADDANFDIYTTGDEPAYIVTYENYDPTKDDYVSSYYVYDTDGHVLAVLGENVYDSLLLNDIPGQEPQACFLDSELEHFLMVDLHSARQVAKIPVIHEGYNLSTNLDRVTAYSSYQYAIAMNNGEIAPDGHTVMHRVAYFNPDGSFDHWEDILLGDNVVMAQPYMAGAALNPYLFNTDSKREYMVLVKELVDNTSSVSVERLYVINLDGEKVLTHEPNEHGKLASVWLQNLTTAPRMVTAYLNDDWQYTLCYTNLPLSGTELQGEGTAENPYLIASAGDMLLIDRAPGACYKVTADLDFSGMVWHSSQTPFMGTFDGQGHGFFNLVIQGAGLFSSLQGTATVKNFNLVDPVLDPVDDECGFITSFTVYSGDQAPVISDINIFRPVVNSTAFNGEFGTIAGYVATMTAINDCGVFDADIYLPGGVVGGIVGREISGTTVSRCYFSGAIEARMAGGIVGSAETKGAAATDCHVVADIKGRRGVGGIAGAMDQERGYRPQVLRCLVEGTLTATATDDPAIGGIAGSLPEVVYDDEVISIHDCVVMAEINFPAPATLTTAHRIVGHSVDFDKIIDWDNIQPGMTEDQYPYLDLHETMLANNYATIYLIDNNFADSPESIEGKTVALEDLTTDFYTSLGYSFGSDASAPWQMTETGAVLYLEGADVPENPFVNGLTNTETISSITLAGRIARAQGGISVYDAQGRLMLKANGVADLSHLPAGVYIIAAQGQTLKAALR